MAGLIHTFETNMLLLLSDLSRFPKTKFYSYHHHVNISNTQKHHKTFVLHIEMEMPQLNLPFVFFPLFFIIFFQFHLTYSIVLFQVYNIVIERFYTLLSAHHETWTLFFFFFFNKKDFHKTDTHF